MVTVRRAGSPARCAAIAALVLMGAGGLTACTSTPGSETSSPVPQTSDPSATSPSPTATPLVVSGTVTEGVEAGCLVLTDGDTTYLLLGAQDQLTPGAEVTVEGTPAEDTMTTCQQGTPLQVRSVRPR